MKAIEIESWALRSFERVENRQPVEDSKVELKADWPEPIKTARRLAGHANAARGENILWLQPDALPIAAKAIQHWEPGQRNFPPAPPWKAIR